MTFGKEWGWGSEPEEAKRILDAYIDRGGNFIDTANGYTKGHSEAIIGEHLAHDRKKRDRVVIATKFVTNMFIGDPNGGGSNRKAVIAQCEESLRRLRTDYIDLYWLHAWDKTTPIEETMRALDTLVGQGKVRYLGFSDTPAWKVAQAQTMAHLRGWSPLIALQIEYSLLQRTVEGELVPMALELGLGITPWGPLRGGALSGKYKRADKGKHEAGRGARVTNYLDDRTFDLLDLMESLARELGTTVGPESAGRCLDDHRRAHDGAARRQRRRARREAHPRARRGTRQGEHADALVPGRHALDGPRVRVRRHHDQRSALEGLGAGAAERRRTVLSALFEGADRVRPAVTR
jgi:aryl-alcohol dehydrogenase-like predicted oxidoreductase